MKFGLCVWSFSDAATRAGRSPDPMTPAGLAAIAASSHLEAVEVPSRWFDGLSPAQLEEFVADLTDKALAVVLDTGGTDVPQDIGVAVESALTTAAALGAKAVRTTISRCLEGDRSRYGYEGWKAHLRALVGPFKKAAVYAAELGIPFGVENHQDICSWELVWLCEQVGSPYFGVVMDCGNALAVGEHPGAFAARVMPYLKHVHLKDYVVHHWSSGWGFVRCPLGAGVVDFQDLIGRFSAGAPGVLCCIELGASTARHVKLLKKEWWDTYDPRPWQENLAAIRELHAAERAPGLDWRTPSESGADPAVVAAYESDQFSESVAYLRSLNHTDNSNS